MRLSPQQHRLYNLTAHDSKLVIADGPVRCGKTTAGLFGLLDYASQYFSGVQFALVVFSDTAYKGVIQPIVREWADLRQCNVHITKDRIVVPSALGGENEFLRITAQNVAAEGRIRGLTKLFGLFITEITLMPPEILAQALARIAEKPQGKIVVDTNPDRSTHWLLTDYIQRTPANGALHVPFTPKDNPILTDEMWAELKALHPPGHLYDRNILGKWVDATGLVWDLDLHEAIQEPPRDAAIKHISVAVDVASASVTHALLVISFPECNYVVDEWRHDAAISGRIPDREQVAMIMKRFDTRLNHLYWVIDSAAQNFHAEVRRAVKNKTVRANQVLNSIKDIELGVESTEAMLSRGTLKIAPNCPDLIKEIKSYIWDEKALERNVNKPLKRNDHGCDALRYWVMAHRNLS